MAQRYIEHLLGMHTKTIAARTSHCDQILALSTDWAETHTLQYTFVSCCATAPHSAETIFDAHVKIVASMVRVDGQVQLCVLAVRDRHVELESFAACGLRNTLLESPAERGTTTCQTRHKNCGGPHCARSRCI